MIVLTMVNNRLVHVKMIFKQFHILEYEKDEVASKNLAKISEDEIQDLKR